MSYHLRIQLDDSQDFYTNLDFITGRVVLQLQRPETIGNVIIKLEGESRTALPAHPDADHRDFSGPTSLVTEDHKILYKILQVFPDDALAVLYPAGRHEFPFKFKIPINNICHDNHAMSAVTGIGGITGPSNTGIFGLGGFRTMNGTRQLMLSHVKSTLPPSLTGFPHEAEIRYYIKVTVQRPGFFKENWRYERGFKFFPIEPPRPDPISTNEAYARRPFAFQDRVVLPPRRFFFSPKTTAPNDPANQTLPCVEMCARLPHPSIITCHQPIPLRLIAKKLVPAQEQVYLTALQITLVGYTNVRVGQTVKMERNRWVLLSAPTISIALGSPTDPVHTEFEVPNTLWKSRPLPNTVAPTFRTCNLERRYDLELTLSLRWGQPVTGRASGVLPQVVSHPLTLTKVSVYSGIKPPPQLLESARHQFQGIRDPMPPYGLVVNPTNVAYVASRVNGNNSNPIVPLPPPRPGANGRPSIPPRPSDPLYPPQLGPDNVPLYDDAPPSYDEAMAESLAGPVDRPAFSGVTAEDAPSSMPPDKSEHN